MGYNVSRREARRLGIKRVRVGETTNQDTTLQDTTPQDPAVQGTLGNYQQELSKAKTKYRPGLLPQFTNVMTQISKIAYDDRTASESKHLQKQGVNPSEISGNTFSSILGNLEKNRGLDISKIYGTTMNAYSQSQNQIGNRIDTLEKNVSAEKNRIQQEKLARLRVSNKKLPVGEEMVTDLSKVKQSLNDWFNKQNSRGVDNLYVPKDMYDRYRKEFMRVYGESKVGEFDSYLENYLSEDNRYKTAKEVTAEKKTTDTNTFADNVVKSIIAGNPDYVAEYKDGSKFINWSAIPNVVENDVRKKLKENNISLN